MLSNRTYAVRLLWLALAVQAGWVLLNRLVLHQSPGLDVIGVVVWVCFAALAALSDRWPASTVVARIVMGIEFLLAVADRFGVLGGPGTSGVSWGDFPHFVRYTAEVAGFAPAGIAPALAVLATIAETVLGVALLVGAFLPLTALATAGLLAVYGICMAVSLPAAQQFHYDVFVLCTGMLTLATARRRPLSLDLRRTKVALDS